METITKTAKCEGCGMELQFASWPVGWVKTCLSQWGKKYEPRGIAWWCARCDSNRSRREHDDSEARIESETAREAVCDARLAVGTALEPMGDVDREHAKRALIEFIHHFEC